MQKGPFQNQLVGSRRASRLAKIHTYMLKIPSALTAVKGQARWRGSRWSPLTAASLREGFTYGGMGLPRLHGPGGGNRTYNPRT
jgi:hypothetical protein